MNHTSVWGVPPPRCLRWTTPGEPHQCSRCTTTTVGKVHPTCNPTSPPTILKPPPTTLPHLRRANPLVGSAAYFAPRQQETHVTIQNGHRATTPPLCAQKSHRATTEDHVTIQMATAPQRQSSQNSHRATTGDHVTIQNCHRPARAHSITTSSLRRENNLF